MKKFFLILFWLLLAAIVVIGVMIYLCFYGNPINKMIASNAVKNHMSENYSDTDYVVEGVHYNFKTGEYFAHITSPISSDSSFTVTVSPNGKNVYDDYDYRVTGRGNTASRIDKVYNTAVESALKGEAFPYTIDILYARMIYKDEMFYEENMVIPERAGEMSELVLDGKYDDAAVGAMGADSGQIVIHICDETVSSERMAEILLGLRAALDARGIGFYFVDAVLEYENGEEGRCEVMGFKYSDICSEGLVERVAAANREAEQYHRKQDEIKLSES